MSLTERKNRLEVGDNLLAHSERAAGVAQIAVKGVDAGRGEITELFTPQEGIDVQLGMLSSLLDRALLKAIRFAPLNPHVTCASDSNADTSSRVHTLLHLVQCCDRPVSHSGAKRQKSAKSRSIEV